MRPMIDDMKTEIKFAIVMLVTLAILAVFISPLTFGPPAPHQKQSSLAHLLAFAFVLCALLLAPLALTASFATSSPDERDSTSDRLALICSRLC